MATISIQKFQSYWRSHYKGDMEIPFSERLLSFLCYHTDVGQIPRGDARSLSPASSHCNVINWKKAITGCYWCSNANTSCQGICCSPLCLLYFHEWCVRKVNKTTQSAICLLPGCEEGNFDKCHNVCSDKHDKEYTEKYSIVALSNDVLITSPKWYIDRTEQIPQKRLYETKMDEDSHVNSSGSNSSVGDVTMKGADSSLFIFSKRLYEGLIYKTDVGPIPRDSYCEEHLKSPFSDYVNWRVGIGGCYLCGKSPNANLYTYVCDKKCYQYLHEWCRRKLSEFGEYLCVYPGCDGLVVGDVKFCSEVHQNELEKNFKVAHNVSITKMPYKFPHWYMDKKLSNQKITRFFSKTDTPAVPQSSNLSVFRTLSERSTSETLWEDIFNKSSQFHTLGNQGNFIRHQSSESDWVTDEHHSLPMHNPCTHGAFGKSLTNDSSDSIRPPPANPDFQQSTNFPSKSLRNQTDNSESMDVIIPQKQKQNPFGKS